MPTATEDLELALELADAADAITLGRFRAADLVVETKPDLTPVSEADRAVEAALRDRLADLRPQDQVFGEEFGGDRTAAPGARRWIVDPIDGTKSYVRGIPAWATLLALEQDGEVMAGVVSAPALGRRWWAERSGGAFVRESLSPEPRPIRVSAVRDLGDAHLCFGGLEEWRDAGRLEALLELGARCWRTRGYGDFWSYMLVAEGAVEIGLDPQVALWDMAAPKIIVEEAGGRLTDLTGTATADGGSAIATNGLVHAAVQAIMGR
jgi:histidinol-phosphatase